MIVERRSPVGPPPREAARVLAAQARVARLMIPGAGLLIGLLLMMAGGSAARRAMAPVRNVSGDPASETRLARCIVPETNATVRLYRGGAMMTAFWYSVTYQRRGGRELQFWYSYARPVVGAIACHADHVTLLGDSGGDEVAMLPAAEIEHDLLPRPLVYRSGNATRLSRDSVEAAGRPEYARIDLGIAIATLAAGSVISLASVIALARARRRILPARG